MSRGKMPRQPSRSGRQEGTHRSAALLKRKEPLKGKSAKTAIPKKRSASRVAGVASRVSTYNPLAPERVRQIIAGLDQLYPSATCALTHRSAWELLVATILSAQSTDVRVNMVTP